MRTAKFIHLPDPYPNQSGTPDDRLRRKAVAGLAERIALLKRQGPLFASKVKEYKKRLNFELRAIQKAKFANYLLVAADIVDYARSQGIPVGPGHGSAPACLVNYALGITKLDPIKHGLIFERFFALNHSQMPRIDIDFCAERRKEIVRYVTGKYGEAQVKILRAPNGHEAGIVLADKPISDFFNLYQAQGNDHPDDTLFDEEQARELGLAVYDFLGLSALTEIDRRVKLVKEKHRRQIDIDAIPLDDKQTWGLFARGETDSVFFMEADGIRQLLMRLKPENINQLAAVNTLYRPGPLKKGIAESYVRRKNGEEDITKIHPPYDELVKETLGLILYQEQVMTIFKRLAGFSMNEAYASFKDFAGDKPEIRTKFLQRCSRRKIPQPKAVQIMGQINRLGPSAFLKAHALCHALISYQTAWLKSNYPTI